jgi:hypothetical protein
MTTARIIRLFTLLRWRMLRGVLASGGPPRWATIVGIVASVLVGSTAGAVVFVAGRRSPDLDALYVITTTLAALLVMMVGVIAGVAQPVDPRVLATEPLTERQLGIGLLAASATGPPGLSALLFGFGLFGGAVRGPWSVVPAGLAVVAVLATLLLVSRTTINALGLVSIRFPRTGQVLIGVSSLAFYAAFQVVPRVIVRLDDDGRDGLARLLASTPMGQLGRALASARDQPAASLAHTAVGAAWLVVLVWVFSWSTHRLIVAIKRTGGRANRRERRWAVPELARWLCGRGPVGAVAWRGVLSRFRTPRTALETFTGGGIGLAIVLVPVLTNEGVGSGAVLVGGAVQLAVLFIAGNSFGSDGPAMANELLTGVDPAVLVEAKARSVVVSAAPIAVAGPLIAAAVTGEWHYLPAGLAIGAAGLFAGAGAAMVQSVLVPIAIPESDNPLASGDSGKGWFAAVTLSVVLVGLAVLTLPVALALLWALDRESFTVVTAMAVLTIGVGVLVMRLGVSVAAARWRRLGPELYTAIVPSR